MGKLLEYKPDAQAREALNMPLAMRANLEDATSKSVSDKH